MTYCAVGPNDPILRLKERWQRNAALGFVRKINDAIFLEASGKAVVCALQRKGTVDREVANCLGEIYARAKWNVSFEDDGYVEFIRLTPAAA